jgi:TRAP-type C4-dicarboxylate transport system permease small subunit
MSLRTARALTVLYFSLSLITTTWPGMLPFARSEPQILGLPFSMAWVAMWLAGSVVVLWLLDRVERRYRDDTGGEG